MAVLAQIDLPFADVRSQELSGIAWEESTRTLFAISDHVPIIVPLREGGDLTTWSFGEPIPVSIPDNWDGEGIALLPDGFLIANETGGHLYELDREGHTRRALDLPPHYTTALRNKSLEALSLSPDGRFIFTANESALESDGSQPTATRGTTVRILRIDRTTSKTIEVAYRTEPVFAEGGGDMGMSEICALSDRELLVLERSYVPGVGNSIRIFRTSIEDAPDVKDVDHLTDATPALPKRLVIDLALAGLEVSPARSQTTMALYPNFEGMALGPRLPDGRRVLFLISDDNGKPTQVTRLLVLAAAGLP
jgi:3-phytase